MAWDVREREISEEQSEEVKGELINMTHTWDKEESESPMGMEPMPMTSRTHGGHSIHWDMRPHGEQGHFKWVHMWQASCILQGGVLVWWTRVLRWIPKTIGGRWTALMRDDWNPREGKRSPRALKAAVDLSEKLLIYLVQLYPREWNKQVTAFAVPIYTSWPKKKDQKE